MEKSVNYDGLSFAQPEPSSPSSHDEASAPCYYRGVPCNLPQAKLNRILSNRASAQKSRDKKKKETEEMKERISALEREKLELQKQVTALQNELSFYKTQEQQPMKKLRLSSSSSLPSPAPSSASLSSPPSSPNSSASSASPLPTTPDSSSDHEISSGEEEARKRKSRIALPELLPVDSINLTTVLATTAISTFNNSNNNNNNSEQIFESEPMMMITDLKQQKSTPQYKEEFSENVASEPAALTLNPLQLEAFKGILLYLMVTGLMLFGIARGNSNGNSRRNSFSSLTASKEANNNQIPLLSLQMKRVLMFAILQMSRLTTFSHLRAPPLTSSTSLFQVNQIGYVNT